MAAKTPVLINYDSPTAYGAHGPMRTHPRPHLILGQRRRARKEADRRFRDAMRSKPLPMEVEVNLADLSKADLQERARAAGKHFTTKTSKRDLIGLIRGAQW